MGAMTIAVRTARGEDLSGMAGALGRAFADDPLFDWLVPDQTRRHRMLPAWLTLAFKKMFTRREVLHDRRSCRRGCVGCPRRMEDQARRDALDDPGQHSRGRTGTHAAVFTTLNAMEKEHPEELHWYLEVLGADPPHQRQGVGAALMKPVLDRCDAEGLPAYLETQKPDNVAYYRHHGFEVREEMDLPKGGPHLWTMWRPPI